MELVTMVSAIFMLVQRISVAAQAATKNKGKCRVLSDNVHIIGKIIRPLLDVANVKLVTAETRTVVGALHNALQEALQLVKSCQQGSDSDSCCRRWLRSLFHGAGGTAAAACNKFDEIEKKLIDRLQFLLLQLQIESVMEQKMMRKVLLHLRSTMEAEMGKVRLLLQQLVSNGTTTLWYPRYLLLGVISEHHGKACNVKPKGKKKVHNVHDGKLQDAIEKNGKPKDTNGGHHNTKEMPKEKVNNNDKTSRVKGHNKNGDEKLVRSLSSRKQVAIEKNNKSKDTHGGHHSTKENSKEKVKNNDNLKDNKRPTRVKGDNENGGNKMEGSSSSRKQGVVDKNSKPKNTHGGNHNTKEKLKTKVKNNDKMKDNKRPREKGGNEKHKRPDVKDTTDNSRIKRMEKGSSSKNAN